MHRISEKENKQWKFEYYLTLLKENVNDDTKVLLIEGELKKMYLEELSKN